MPTPVLLLAVKGRRPEGLDFLAGCLRDLGVAPTAIVESTEKGKSRIAVYPGSTAAARRLAGRIRALRLKGVAVRFKQLRTADWRDKWKRYVRPFPITPRLRLVPAWHAQAKQGPGAGRIVLETGMAFGTGQHPTTRWTARNIDRVRGRFQSFLDIGTGTGVLSVVAHRCGAKRITAVDIEPEAARVAEANLARNGCAGYRVACRDFGSRALRGSFDLVAANLTTDDLIRWRERLAALVRPGGYLAVSGIGQRKAPDFRRRFIHAGPWRCLHARVGRSWAAFLLRRRDTFSASAAS